MTKLLILIASVMACLTGHQPAFNPQAGASVGHSLESLEISSNP